MTRLVLREPPPPEEPTGSLTRRGLLAAAGLGALALVTATAGQSLAPLRRVSLLAPRRGDIGPQGLPVNKTARGAGVLDSIADPAWRLAVDGPAALMLSLADLRAMPQRTVRARDGTDSPTDRPASRR